MNLNEEKFYLGFDVGGTKIEAVACTLNHSTHELNVLLNRKKETPKNAQDFLFEIKCLIKELVNDSNINVKNIEALGFGLPGSLHPETKIMLNGNTQFLIGVDLKKEIQLIIKDVLGSEVALFLENDANCFVLAEAWAGAGYNYQKTHQTFFHDQVAIGITLGTGVGGGLFSGGKILTGALGAGMEVGHMSLDPVNGPQCYCGQKGCAESFLSGSALNRLMDSKEIFRLSKLGDANALNILNDYRKKMLHFLSVLINLINPHYIVFGGGLAEQESLFSNLKEDLEGFLFLGERGLPEIYISKLPLNAGVYGAVINAFNQLK